VQELERSFQVGCGNEECDGRVDLHAAGPFGQDVQLLSYGYASTAYYAQ